MRFLVYFIVGDDFYAVAKKNPDLLARLDTSGLPSSHPCYSNANKKVPGLWSDETLGKSILEFISLRPKCYGFDLKGKKKIKAKGILGHVVKNHLTVEDLKRCLYAEEKPAVNRENVSIRSFQHQIYTIKTMKMTLNRSDDKRFIDIYRITTYAYGHYKVENEDNIET
ncbi:uncharacterized protein LOC126895935 [Daktulosphaira vitifoliae]|uniref:uncharacterized protein LOC126895935 n=1 Tax=Daktulosphaira vitifoliae TaxID=58002 RepID=UPI0021AB06BD|nr:uncharacterized protein LOC126895935 [Daktulosphaira vitifoliae]